MVARGGGRRTSEEVKEASVRCSVFIECVRLRKLTLANILFRVVFIMPFAIHLPSPRVSDVEPASGEVDRREREVCGAELGVSRTTSFLRIYMLL